jgi:hypothetical protein
LDTTLPPAFDPALESNKTLAQAKSALAKKFRFDKQQPLYDAVRLAYLLWVFGKESEAREVCQTLARIEFNGSFELWSPVEKALALESRLARQAGDQEASTKCVARIREAGFVPERLSGIMLDRRGDIPDAIRDGDKKAERMCRLILASELAFLIELGGSEVCPVEKLEQDWQANITELKRLVGAPC